MASLLISKRQWIATAKLLVFCGVIFSFVAACGDNKAATSGSTGDASASFNVHWNPGQTQSAGFSTLSLNCAAQGIVTVLCYIYDEQETPLAYGGPWDCSDGGGTITRIPPGPQRTFVILGLDEYEQIVYQGQSARIDLEPGDNNDAGTIEAFPFRPILLAPVDGAQMPPGPVSLTWQAVNNASAYRIFLATDSDFTDAALIVEASTAHTLNEYRSGPDYYWRVLAIDRYGNESAPSDPLRLFKTTGMWQYTYGEGKAHSVQVAPDGSYIVAGESQSGLAFLLKVDRSGAEEFYRTYIPTYLPPPPEGISYEYSAAYSVQVTADGGYILAGIVGVGVGVDAGSILAYVVKTDSNGYVEWEWHNLYDADWEYYEIYRDDRVFDIQIADGGYVAVGRSTNMYGLKNGYILKIHADGNLDSEIVIEDWNSVEFKAVQVVSDGYVIAGTEDLEGFRAYLVKMDLNGEGLWEPQFGDWESTWNDVWTTPEGDFIIAGSTYTSEMEETKAYLNKIHANGNSLWGSGRTFGISQYYYDSAKAVRVTTPDGNFIVVGETAEGQHNKIYLAEIDKDGESARWQKPLGEEGVSSYANSLQVTPDNGFIIAGYTDPNGSATPSVLLLKTDANGNLE